MINLGSQAVGIMNICKYGNKLFTVNKSPFSTPDAGSISTYNLADGSFVNTLLNKNVGSGAGTAGNLLYFGYNYGIGAFNMNTLQMQVPVVVPDPGSSIFRYITSATVDTLNGRLFVNTGDYAGPGTCLIYGVNGDSLGNFPTGISTDAIALDFRVAATGIKPNEISMNISLYPDPVSARLTVKLPDNQVVEGYEIRDVVGKVVLQQTGINGGSALQISVGGLKEGVYFIRVSSATGDFTRKFIKR